LDTCGQVSALCRASALQAMLQGEAMNAALQDGLGWIAPKNKVTKIKRTAEPESPVDPHD